MTLVKRQRLIRGWSQSELARRARVNQGTVSNIEAGKSNNPVTMKRVADELDLKMEELLIEELKTA